MTERPMNRVAAAVEPAEATSVESPKSAELSVPLLPEPQHSSGGMHLCIAMLLVNQLAFLRQQASGADYKHGDLPLAQPRSLSLACVMALRLI
jgi:hypothetical protein